MAETPCWCGEKNAYFAPLPVHGGCGGSGTIECYCGGDLCVCHNHGEIACDGCDDCAGLGDELDD